MDDVYVMTVLGPIPAAELGITLMHEHLIVDVTSWWHPPADAALADAPVSAAIYGELRMDPFGNRDNCRLDDPQAAAEEVQIFRDLGGRTVADVTSRGIGRNPNALRAIARATGLNVIMGTGFYLEAAHPPEVHSMSADTIAQLIESDIVDGVDGIRAGIIGEIGISAAFSAEEQKVLRGAARAQRATRVPLTIHMPGWERLGHRVLDLLAEEGIDLHCVILDHMNPSGIDLDYQASLAERGAYLEYDMVGMDYYYADQQAQSPCDEENAAAVRNLIRFGHLSHLLLSQDVFLKMMLTSNGGFGYAYVLRHFVPRLRRHGVTEEQVKTMLIENPRRVFVNAAKEGS